MMTTCKSCNVLPQHSRVGQWADIIIDPKFFGPALYAHSCSPHVQKIKRFGFGNNYVNFGNGNFREVR